ncbi:MAG TPA: ATPase domain-containing protein, partial [Nitrososphaerales archaeon]|nr:ATPase domain-containing protein [Nitrososphaerales archaeon]
YRRSIELNSNYSTVHHWFAQLLSILGRREEAIKEGERARELDPLSPTTFMTLGFVHVHSGNFRAAITELETYREIDPNYSPANLWLGIAYTESSRFDEAIPLLRAACERLPVAKIGLAYAYARAKKAKEALEILAEVEKGAEDRFVMAEIAGVYLILGMNKEFTYWQDCAFAEEGTGSNLLLQFYPWSALIKKEVGAENRIVDERSSLDKFLFDGLPSKSTLLIVGGAEVGKEALVYRMVSAGLSKGELCIYLTGLSTREVLRGMKAFGISVSEADQDNLFWISGEGGALIYNPNDLSGLSFKLKEVLKKNHDRKIRIITDALSPLLMLNSKETVYRFLSQLFFEVKQYDAVLVATLEENMHDSGVVAAMKQLFDGFVEVRSVEGKDGKSMRIVNVKKLRGVSVPGESRSFNL